MSNMSRMAAVHALEGLGDPVRGGGADYTPSPTEERILSAALRLLARRGVRRLGMQEVSEAAGVSRGTLYRYFPSKDHLLAAVAGFDEHRFSTVWPRRWRP